jgi:NTE family protein
MHRDHLPFTVAYGGGGLFGIAYGLGVAHGLRDGGVDLGDVPALGTSAGSWVASAMALGVEFDAFDEMEVPAIPNLRSGTLAAAATTLFGDARHPNVTAVAVPITSGRRRLLRGDRHRLADLCAASSAVPGVFAPHRVGRRLYVDGGVRSGVSADAAPAADHLVVIVPLGGPVLVVAGRGLDAMLSLEVAAWRRAHPLGQVTVVRPNRAIAASAGINPANLFDADRAKAAYPLAVEQGRRWADRVHEREERRVAA